MIRELNGATRRTLWDQSNWFCCAVSLVVSATVTVCFLVLRYRPDAMSITILPIIVCAMLMGVVMKSVMEELVRNGSFLCVSLVAATTILSSWGVVSLADRTIISRGIDAVLLTYSKVY